MPTIPRRGRGPDYPVRRVGHRYGRGVPLFEIRAADLLAFRALRGGAQLYESEIEDLVWSNPDELTGPCRVGIAGFCRGPPGVRHTPDAWATG
jgi:hypothetical protein